MTWVLWVGVLVTSFCRPGQPCLPPYTMQETPVRPYLTRDACEAALPETRRAFELVWNLLDHPHPAEWQGPPAERRLRVWCAPAHPS